jgi:hypothetical protein
VGGLNFQGVNPKSDIVVGSGNGGFLVVYLLKALFRDSIFFRVKIRF